ncbi:MAG: radical SAM protein [Candidatus Omnitrophica bacterium]|nr:radical SAM protein [Candidatus Omnitrophota bacterium]
MLVTLRCNLDCGYCSVARISHEGKADLWEREATLEKVKCIFANPLFANCLLVDLLGGEPLLVEDLGCIIAYLTERGHITNISTNGLLLAQRIAELRQAGVSRINVSIYDTNQSDIEGDLPEINRVFPVHASIVLLRTMVEKFPEGLLNTARFLRDAGCLSLRFFMYRPVGIKPKPEEIIPDNSPAYIELQRRINEALPGFCLWPAVVKAKGAKKRCPQLWQRISCDMSGKMAVCCGTDMILEGPNSNLFENAPEEIFNHPTLVKMRQGLLDPNPEPPQICKTCNLLEEPGW